MVRQPSGTSYDVVVLAGGRARRLGGQDKPALVVGGRTLLDAVLAAAVGAAETVVVGPARPTARPVRQVREEPPGAGPVAALQAGLPLTGSPVVVLLAADLPGVTAADVEALVAGVTAEVGLVGTDADGRRQWLLSAWPRDALVTAAAGVAPDAPLRAVLGDLPCALLPLHRAAADCDTADDLEEARRGAGRVG